MRQHSKCQSRTEKLSQQFGGEIASDRAKKDGDPEENRGRPEYGEEERG
jgi:hypothetical protein